MMSVTERMRLKFAPFVFPDVRFISFPRSGRIWIKNITSRIALELGYKRHSGLFLFKHDGTRLRTFIKLKNPLDAYIKDKTMYKDNDVIYLVREPRDAIISGYYYLAYRWGRFNPKRLSLSSYLHRDMALPLAVDYMNQWARQRSVPRRFMIITYEDALKDMFSVISMILQFIKLEVPEDVIRRCIQDCSAENLCAVEKQYFFKTNLRPRRAMLNRNIPHSFHANNPVAGNFLSELSQEDIDFSTEYLKEHLDPYYWFYPMNDPRKAYE
jgi:hypothetical protein